MRIPLSGHNYAASELAASLDSVHHLVNGVCGVLVAADADTGMGSVRARHTA